MIRAFPWREDTAVVEPYATAYSGFRSAASAPLLAARSPAASRYGRTASRHLLPVQHLYRH